MTNTYTINYCVDVDEGDFFFMSEGEEEFEGTHPQLMKHLEALKRVGCYGINVECKDENGERW